MGHSQVKANNAWVFFKEVAKNTLKWEHVSIDVKQPLPQPPIRVACIGSTPILRMMPKPRQRLEALEMSKGAQSLALEPSKHVVSFVCILCDSRDHLIEQCPGLLVIKAKQANVLNTFASPN